MGDTRLTGEQGEGDPVLPTAAPASRGAHKGPRAAGGQARTVDLPPWAHLKLRQPRCHLPMGGGWRCRSHCCSSSASGLPTRPLLALAHGSGFSTQASKERGLGNPGTTPKRRGMAAEVAIHHQGGPGARNRSTCFQGPLQEGVGEVPTEVDLQRDLDTVALYRSGEVAAHLPPGRGLTKPGPGGRSSAGPGRHTEPAKTRPCQQRAHPW